MLLLLSVNAAKIGVTEGVLFIGQPVYVLCSLCVI